MNKLELCKNLERYKNEKTKIKKSDVPTFLSVINKDYAETYISSLIAYVLKNDKSLLESLIINYYDTFNRESIDVHNLLDFDLSDIEVKPEQYMDGRRADIIVIIEKVKTTITIENKINTWEHDEQTIFYYNWINRNYSDYNNIFFYLHPDYNLSSPSSTEYYDIRYSEFNKLISESKDVIVHDLKNHIKQRLEVGTMEFNEYEKEIINNINDYRNIINDVEGKINTIKENIVEKLIEKMSNSYSIIFWKDYDEEKAKGQSDNILLYEKCFSYSSLESFRLYRPEWFFKCENNDEYYFYVEIKFDNKYGPFENISFQRTIKDKNKKSDFLRYLERFNQYYVMDKKNFVSNGLPWDDEKWSENLVKNAYDTLLRFIKEHDNEYEQFIRYINNIAE